MSALLDSSLLFLAQTAPAEGGRSGASLMSFLPFILIFVAMYFLMIAPQRKKQKQHQQMLASLDAGDEVITAGGIYGHITAKKDDRFVIRISDNTKIEVGKGYITSVVAKKSGGEEKK
ncbi:preprotein translocase subunit YajC [Termitidicoccus mucosus]|uniref:Sec translocon accessory complex subunit YajC n=1 Tax=Termitidicoccus mucosus TaxID=1184151 RepID=A0A178IH93_9BACT|nr:preprotein translocase subunit YajC [Opitutaceae bacterium TSB47]